MKSTTSAAQPRSEKVRTVTGKAPSSTANNEERIREKAYGCWEKAGCPTGDGVEFWLKAEAELALETGPRSTDDEPRSPRK